MRHLDLFSGIGGFSLGLERTGGFNTVAFCEVGGFQRQVLKKHWPNIKQYTDVKKLTYEQLKNDQITPVDIITGGYPCQPFSVAGKQHGEQDPRHLWPEMFRIIQECRPTWVIGENVSGHIKLGLDSVLQDLESANYSTRTFVISASGVGANHQRQRTWVLGHSEHHGLSTSTQPGIVIKNGDHLAQRTNQTTEPTRTSKSSGDVDVENSVPSCWRNWWESEPPVGRVANGISGQVDRLKSLGNSLVPAIPYAIGLAILETLNPAARR